MSLERKPDLMDYRVLAILQITIESNELLTSQDVHYILETRHRIKLELEEVEEILESLAKARYLVKYSPIGLPAFLETWYIGPKLPKQKGRRHDS